MTDEHTPAMTSRVARDHPIWVAVWFFVAVAAVIVVAILEPYVRPFYVTTAQWVILIAVIVASYVPWRILLIVGVVVYAAKWFAGLLADEIAKRMRER